MTPKQRAVMAFTLQLLYYMLTFEVELRLTEEMSGREFSAGELS